MKVLMYTVAFGQDCIKKANVTNPFKRAYCKKHGYEYFYEEFPDKPLRHPYWMKVEYGLKFIKNYDLLIWCDADAAPVDFDKRVEDYMPADKSFAVCKDVIAWNGKSWYFNAGVFIIRGNDWGKELLEEWNKEDDESRKNPLHDQTRINGMYLRNWNNMHLQTEIWEKNTLQNTKFEYYRPGCFIKHCAATSARDMQKRFWDKLDESKYAPYGINNVFVGEKPSVRQVTKTSKVLANDIAICSYSCGEANFKANITNPFKIIYANIHGYAYHFGCYGCKTVNAAKWEKIRMVAKLLNDYQYVMWLDSDAAPVNFDIKIEDLLNGKDSDFFIERDSVSLNGKEWYMNSGMFIVKNSEWSHSFLDEWAKKDNGTIKNPVQDQLALNEMYDRNWNNMRQHCFIWPKLTLQPVHCENYKSGMFVKHCCATSNKDFHQRWWDKLDDKMFMEKFGIIK